MLLSNKALKISLRIRCYVFSVLFHGMEAWTLTEIICKSIEAFGTWCCRRMLWMKRMTNQVVFQRLNKEIDILNTTKRRRLEYFGHVIKNPNTNYQMQLSSGKQKGSTVSDREEHRCSNTSASGMESASRHCLGPLLIK